MENKVKVVIECGKDGLYSAYCPDYKYLDKYSFGGYGKTAQQAIEDFRESVSEIKDICSEFGDDSAAIDKLSFDWAVADDVSAKYGEQTNISHFGN